MICNCLNNNMGFWFSNKSFYPVALGSSVLVCDLVVIKLQWKLVFDSELLLKPLLDIPVIILTIVFF